MVDLPHDEAQRLDALYRYKVLDTTREGALDDLAAMAAYVCRTPMAMISLVDSDRQWFKSSVGWDATETPRQDGFCTYAIRQPDAALIVLDAGVDDRFSNSPLVKGEPYIRFYVGAPLVTPSGYAIGTLCALDRIPRQINPDQVEALQVLSRQVVMQLELRANVTQLEHTVSRQHKVERALHLSNQRFRQTLHELQQTQTQLIQTEKMSSLGQMVAGIAHEINNPVSFVYGNLTYVNRYIDDLFNLLSLYQRYYPEPDPTIQECANSIDLNFVAEDLPKILNSMKVGADRIRQIVLSLRNFSRSDEFEKKPVDIHQGIENTLLILQHRFKPTADNPGIELVKQYGDIPPVECFSGQLNQVFMNIISNAIDALEQTELETGDRPTQRNRITITTELSILDDDATIPSVVIRIADNGPGVSPDILQQIFDPFFTTKPVGKGTGLGLSISYQIVVERHGGMLRCFSEPGQGTEFWIEIPLYSSVPTTPPTASSAGSTSSAGSASSASQSGQSVVS